jgi:hypothetical protein
MWHFYRAEKSLNRKMFLYRSARWQIRWSETVADWELVAIDEGGRCNLVSRRRNAATNVGEKSMRLVFMAILFMCAFFGSSSGEPQKHAPSAAQCRSDAAAWNKEEDTGPKDKDVGYRLPFGELLKRQREMMSCVKSDAQHDQYRTIYHVYTTAMYARYQHFLERHQLMEQFLDEDSKGSRWHARFAHQPPEQSASDETCGRW